MPTEARTAALQLGTHMSGPHGGEEIREGKTRAQTWVFWQLGSSALIDMLGPNRGVTEIHDQWGGI